jgi:hypothetical protein
MSSAERLAALFPGAVGGLPVSCAYGCDATEAIWHGSVLVVHGPTCAGREDRVGAPVYTDRDTSDD